MLTDINYPNDGIYRSGSDNEPMQFYIETLAASNRFDILLGYFSSSAISVLSVGFAKFLANGGEMRMIINHILSEQDKAAILKGSTNEASLFDFDINNITHIKSSLDAYGQHFFECLSWMIAAKKIQIKVVKPSNSGGISHYKSGIFSDGTNRVSFNGSCNFTASGLLGNLEELHTKQSWENKKELAQIENQEEYFEHIFSGKADFVENIPFLDIEIAIRDQFGNKDINELLVQEQELISKKKAQNTKQNTRKALEKIEADIVKKMTEPHFPNNGTPREYQKQAYQNWLENDKKGIFAMATGTGKTITALNCVLEEYRKKETASYRILILVPTISLLEQWEKEAKKFNFKEIIKVSSKSEWENDLADKIAYAKRLKTENFVVLVTYTSFAREKFQSYFNRFPLDTILVADEAHNIASPKVLSVLEKVKLEDRIGLSATPKRIYDPEGSIAMQDFFQDKEPYTYSFSMDKAIEEGVLCKYYYYPHIITLTSVEFSKYQVLTKKLMQFFDPVRFEFKDGDAAKKLLLERKRIIHKAENKLGIVQNILKKQYQTKGNLKYTLIYVPEGYEDNNSETYSENEEELHIINQYCETIHRINSNINVSKFISDISNREEVLKQFQKGDIHVLASMKCLDEGVDVPRAEFAIFCSSTGNPRQFIQRRGRILRQHQDKHLATIHDLVVVPEYKAISKDKDSYNIERNLTKKELERVMYFASLAINPVNTEQVFQEVCEHYELNLSTIKNNLKST